MADDLKSMALDYHRFPRPGKLEITPTKKVANQRDLALAYSPGVADACMLIADDPKEAANMTARGNLVAVISNGTAVLGLGNIGALASKPVMEGKAVLFKKFAGVDVFDIEVDETDPDKMVEIVRALEPTFGGVNLEDIKAPECFIIEAKCRETMNIPVFHDDQHGTAICVAAAIYNALRLVDKKIEDVKVVVSGAGAAAQACTMQILSLGAKAENIRMCDRKGVIYQGREGVDQFKSRFAVETDERSLDDAIDQADVFLGVSGPGTMTGDMVKKMAKDPIVLALANPTPEILPEEAKAARDDVIMATGRSDYPNQVNNVLCFPFIFRGALDCGATVINEEMKIATVKAIADLALAEPSEVVASAYQGEKLTYGRDYLIPKPFDPRLIVHIAPAVVQAAMDSGVATRPITDMDAYIKKLEQFIYESGQAMRPIFERAKESPKRVIYAEGEDPRVLRTAQIVVEDGYASPILVGDKGLIEARAKDLGLADMLGSVSIVDPHAMDAGALAKLVDALHAKLGRAGVSPGTAERMLKSDATVLAAMLLDTGAGDAMLCGAVGGFSKHLREVFNVIGLADGVSRYSAVQMVLTQHDTIFITDSHANLDPSADHLATMVPQAAKVVERFGLTPKVAMCSHANFGTEHDASARKMRRATDLIRAQNPDLEIDGEMQVDAALNENIRKRLLPGSTLSGRANLLVMPDIDAANISFNLVKQVTQGLSVGPIMTGLAKPAHVVATAISTRGLVNMTAMAVVDAQDR
ncbi:MAG: NADP-dependent malic enzyme [Alphaproteobacteria bacterium]